MRAVTDSPSSARIAFTAHERLLATLVRRLQVVLERIPGIEAMLPCHDQPGLFDLELRIRDLREVTAECGSGVSHATLVGTEQARGPILEVLEVGLELM